MPGCMNIGDSRMDDLGSETQQAINHASDVGFVSGNGMTRQNHRVMFSDLEPLTVAARHQRQRRHWFALASRRNNAHLARWIVVGLLDINQCVVWDSQHSKISGHAHILLH